MKYLLVIGAVAALAACSSTTAPQLASCHEKESAAFADALHVAQVPADMWPKPEPTVAVWRLDPVTIITFTRTPTGCDAVRLQ